MTLIIYAHNERTNDKKIAHKTQDGRWAIFVGKRGGDLRFYKTEQAMDKEMVKRGYTRKP